MSRILGIRGVLATCLAIASVNFALAQSSEPIRLGAGPVPPANCPPIPICPPLPGAITPETTQPVPSDAPVLPSFSDPTSGAGVGSTVAVAPSKGGYIDLAAPQTLFRLRYDNATGSNRPDRAEFFYAKCGCFRAPPALQLDAQGPPRPETNIDYQELTPYFEYALNPKLSVFLNIPFRFIDPTMNRNDSGISDVDFGFKYAFLQSADRVVSFQLRTIVPSGGASKGLGSGNWWIEPGLLFQQNLAQSWQVFGELRDQIPLSPRSDFTGNVLRYGLGTSVNIFQTDTSYLAPVGELVGWTVLSGRELADGNNVSAKGATIVNAKIGLRMGFGGMGLYNAGLSGVSQTPNDIYIGYGRALTGEVWYKNILRVEYRRFF